MQDARAGLQVSDAVDELLSWEALTVTAGLDATDEEVYAHLRRAAAADPGGGEATERDARLLADLEVTVAVGDPEHETELRHLDAEDDLDGAMTVNFGGRDIAGVKNIEDRTYVRVGAEALVADVLGGDEEAVARAHRFEDDASALPDSLRAAGRALGGDWVEVDPDRWGTYADAFAAGLAGDDTDGTDGGAAVGARLAAQLAGALADGGDLLAPEAQWEFVAGLRSALGSGASLSDEGEERGARIVGVTLPAGDAYRALAPLLGLLDGQSERFGIPSLVAEPADPDAPVEARLEIRNGVLTGAVFDLAQFAGEDAGTDAGTGPLPLELDLAGGSALNLDPPASDGPLAPEDVTVALLYLELREQERAEDPSRADLPGPMQP